MTIDVGRRFFCFGAAATLLVPKPKSFFIVSPPKLIVTQPDRPFDLPMAQMLSLMRRLDAQELPLSAVPRWCVADADWYDAVVRGDTEWRSTPTATSLMTESMRSTITPSSGRA